MLESSGPDSEFSDFLVTHYAEHGRPGEIAGVSGESAGCGNNASVLTKGSISGSLSSVNFTWTPDDLEAVIIFRFVKL